MIFFSRPQGYSAVGYIGPSYRLRLLKAISRHMERTPPTPHLFVDVSEYLFAQWPKATVLAPEEKDEVIQEFIHTIQPILLAVPHRQLCFLLFSFLCVWAPSTCLQPTFNASQLSIIFNSLGKVAMLEWDMADAFGPVVAPYFSQQIVQPHILGSISGSELVKAFWAFARLRMDHDVAVPIICQHFLEAQLVPRSSACGQLRIPPIVRRSLVHVVGHSESLRQIPM